MYSLKTAIVYKIYMPSNSLQPQKVPYWGHHLYSDPRFYSTTFNPFRALGRAGFIHVFLVKMAKVKLCSPTIT